MANITHFNGDLGSPKGKTSFGHFDGDPDFLTEAPKVGDWVARKLGWPSVDIEITEKDLYNSFEEAVLEFSSIVNDANIQNNLGVLKGNKVSEMGNLSGSHVTGSAVRETVRLAKSYGSQIGHGGDVNYYKTYIDLQAGEQKYDIEAMIASRREDGQKVPIAINKVYHYGPTAQSRMHNPFSGSGAGISNMINSFGWSGMGVSVGASHFVQPVYYDLMKMQAVEFNDQVRRSQYSYKLQNNVITIFPMPKKNGRLWFEFAYEEDLDNAQIVSADPEAVVSDYSNVPYDVIPYENVNAPSRRWIMKFALAEAKDKLGQVRSKIDSIPSPGDSFRLNGSDLKQEAQQEKQNLRQELRERLQKLSRSEQIERQRKEGQALQENLKKIPLGLYTG